MATRTACLLAALFCAAAAGSSALTLSLPLLTVTINLPPSCGAVAQVGPTDTCQSLADFAGISLAQFNALNPLVLCGPLLNTLQLNALVCVGDKLASCNDRVVTAAGDSCSGGLAGALGTIVGLPLGVTCDNLPVGTTVCAAPSVNNCAVSNICGVDIPAPVQSMLGNLPDYCQIIKSCEGTLTPVTVNGISSIQLGLTSVTPSVAAVQAKDGHPELNLLPANLAVTFVPQYQGKDTTYYTTAPGSGGRKLLGGAGASSGARPRQDRYPGY